MNVFDFQKNKCIYCDVNMTFDFNVHSRTPTDISIQRVDNSKGHNKYNCVLCCIRCNYTRQETKHDMDYYTECFNYVRNCEAKASI